MSPPLVLYHAACSDGFCAAWVARRRFPDAECVPVQHGDATPDVAGRTVYLLDFSLKREQMQQVIGLAHSVCVLDHHESAIPDLSFPSCSAADWWDGSGRIYIGFDTSKSGARLAWEFFFPGVKSPWLVDYTEDRDLWRWRLPRSREISAFIRSWPFDFARWDAWAQWGEIDTRIFREQVRFAIAEGGAILRSQQQLVDEAVARAGEHVVCGYKVLATNATVMISEIAGKLAEGRPFGATFFIRADGARVWSLRSEATGVNVAQLAKELKGGGGHPHAAGFTER